ncbi:unnamed protein product [Rhizopus stolonifer]
MKGVIWRHWTCCSDQVFENMRKAMSGPEELNGWNELREDDQERVRRGWNEGSIPDNERPDPAYPKEAKNKVKKEKGGEKIDEKNEISEEEKETAPKEKEKEKPVDSQGKENSEEEEEEEESSKKGDSDIEMSQHEEEQANDNQSSSNAP